MKRFLPTLLFLVALSIITGKAQNLTYTNSVYNQTGQAGVMVTPQLEITNAGTVTVGVHVKRIVMALPPTWTSCFCYIECNPPELSQLTFSLVPGEKAYIGIGFNTDATPNTGTVSVTVEELNSGLPKDTLTFTASTLVNSLLDNTLSSDIKVFPNPASEKIKFEKNFHSIQITDESGKITRSLTNTNEAPVSDLERGVYTLTFIDQNGNRFTKKFIKN
jgi:hypothetical protein